MTTITASRTGLAYTDEDHDTLLSMLREGASTPEIAVALCRTVKSVEQRARKLLPPGQRHCPLDRVMPTLATACADPDYDWRTTISQDDPPAPINKIVRSGIEGLTDDQLVECAHAVAVCGPQAGIFDQLKKEVNERGLGQRICARHRLHRRLQEQPNPDQCDEISRAWSDAIGFDERFGSYRYRYSERWYPSSGD